jgi:hypothetical protein
MYPYILTQEKQLEKEISTDHAAKNKKMKINIKHAQESICYGLPQQWQKKAVTMGRGQCAHCPQTPKSQSNGKIYCSFSGQPQATFSAVTTGMSMVCQHHGPATKSVTCYLSHGICYDLVPCTSHLHSIQMPLPFFYHLNKA